MTPPPLTGSEGMRETRPTDVTAAQAMATPNSMKTRASAAAPQGARQWYFYDMKLLDISSRAGPAPGQT